MKPRTQTAAEVPTLGITIAEAATALSIGTTAIRAMVRSGELPVAYFGRSPRVLLADLQRVAEERAAQRGAAIRAEQEVIRRMQAEMPAAWRRGGHRRTAGRGTSHTDAPAGAGNTRRAQ
jgi:excisionase family DNA binding protein